MQKKYIYVSSKRKYGTFLYYLELGSTFLNKFPNLETFLEKTGSIQPGKKKSCLLEKQHKQRQRQKQT